METSEGFLIDSTPRAGPSKGLAIVIKGNPKYLDDPRVQAWARALYGEVQRLLEARGYEVEFDEGAPYTQPREGAAVWVGHSRGIDRLRFVPAQVKTVALETLGGEAGFDAQGLDPNHYKLSVADLKALGEI